MIYGLKKHPTWDFQIQTSNLIYSCSLRGSGLGKEQFYCTLDEYFIKLGLTWSVGRNSPGLQLAFCLSVPFFSLLSINQITFLVRYASLGAVVLLSEC